MRKVFLSKDQSFMLRYQKRDTIQNYGKSSSSETSGLSEDTSNVFLFPDNFDFETRQKAKEAIYEKLNSTVER